MSQAGSTSYAHGHSAETVKGHSHRTAQICAAFILPYIKPGDSILDVGCGPGSITKGLAELVSPPGRVIGIDQAESVIAAAAAGPGQEAKSQGLNLEFKVGDVFHLAYEDNTFDIVYAHQVFVHLPLERVPAALSEVCRVCKPGGLVAIRDYKPDFGGHQIFPFHPLIPRMFDIIMARSGNADQAAGHFLRLARGAGFARVQRTFSQEAFEGEVGRRVWGEQWAKRSSEGSFRAYALEKGMATEEELDRMSAAWREWVEDDDGWATMLTIEHTCWK